MALPLTLPALDQLPRTPATEVKTQGWRGLMRTVGRTGKVAVTHHDTPEAVVLSAEEYDAIATALHAAAERGDPAMDALRRSFDDRLAALEAADAGVRLRGLMSGAVAGPSGPLAAAVSTGGAGGASGSPSQSLPPRLPPTPLRLNGAVIAGARPAGVAGLAEGVASGAGIGAARRMD